MEYFFALEVSPKDYNEKLLEGWRRFGYFFFRPQCGECSNCYECIPIRINVNEFNASKSQRRNLRKNRDTRVKFSPMAYSDEIYSIYAEHSLHRFAQKTTKEDFIQSFYTNALPAMQAEYYVDSELAGVGFLDLASEALSSVYFIYKSAYSHLGLGNFGAMKEIEQCRSMGLKYYYLGYYIEQNHSMAYKNSFKPYELYDWKKKKWHIAEDKE